MDKQNLDSLKLFVLCDIFNMSAEKERSPSIRSRQVLIKVSQASKRLPQDFFVSKSLATSPQKQHEQAPPQSALQRWYDGQDSEGKRQGSKVPFRNKQFSRVLLLKPNQSQSPVKFNQRQQYYHHLLDTMQKKQKIVFKVAREQKYQKKTKIIERITTGCEQKRQSSRMRGIRSQEKGRRTLDTPEKEKPVPVREIRLSLKQLPRKSTPEGRYNHMNVGFDGLLTFNRLQ